MNRVRFRLIVPVLLLFTLAGCKLTTRNTDVLDNFLPKVGAEKVANYQRDVAYAAPGGRALTLDVSWPEGKGPFPILGWVHGGNYDHFSKESGEALARAVTNRGYVVFNINYRPVPEAHLKEITEDVMAAVIWAKDHAADYHGDPARVALAGHSAGGQLAESVAISCRDPFFTPSYLSPAGADACVQAVITVGGYFAFEPEWAPWNEWLLGASREKAPELYAQCEPSSHDLHGLPPHLIVFGEFDMHRARGEAWAQKLTSANVSAQTYLVPGAKHHFIMWHWKKETKKAYRKITEFLDDTLRR
jgi:acetyl esterase